MSAVAINREWPQAGRSSALGSQIVRRTPLKSHIAATTAPSRQFRVDLSDGALDIEVTGEEPDWLYHVLGSIRELSFLQESWDSYGGRGVAFDAAYNALDLLAHGLAPDAAPPSLVPGSDGSLQLEWHRLAGDLEVTFSPVGLLQASYSDVSRADGLGDGIAHNRPTPFAGSHRARVKANLSDNRATLPFSVNSHPLDDPSIQDSAVLWRRIPPQWWVADERSGGRRLSTQAFENSRDGSGTSVALAAETTLEIITAGFAGYGIAALTAAVPRAFAQGVRRVPIDNFPGHAQIEGKKTNSVKKGLVAAALMIKEPTTG